MYGSHFQSYALSLNADLSQTEQSFDEIITVSDEKVRGYDTHSIACIIEELHTLYTFDSILILATHFGRMLAPSVSMRLNTGLVADVTEIKHHQDKVEMIRPAFSGKLLVGIINTQGNLIMMSIRPGIFLYENEVPKCANIRNYQPKNISVSQIKHVSRKDKPALKDIQESDILISGGGGILKDFDLIDELAEQLGGMKAASRKVVDSGKADRNIQVGQSGKIVHPRLYIALGIYGALQHITGLNHVEHIISVNTNKNAPMCSLADLVVEGDAKTFLLNLIKRIRRG